ncbi:MAG: hypothetical protein OEY44_01365 [Candidatus Peregrinibacteria bacterium]|nr:hypothetical protein [Candidatus Peregrinibacteria bacterium]
MVKRRKAETLRDFMVQQNELGTSDLRSLYYARLADRIDATDGSESDKKDMLDLVMGYQQGRTRMSGVWQGGLLDQDTTDEQLKVKATYVKLGLSRMLLHGDWRANRGEEMAGEMGLQSITQRKANILRFKMQHGYEGPTRRNENKLNHIDVGCGNAVFIHRQRNSDIRPLADMGDQRPLGSFWEEFGFADTLYYSANDLIAGALRKEYQEDEALVEFADVVSTLLLRQIHFGAKEMDAGTNDIADEVLQGLATSPDSFKLILPSLSTYIPGLKLYQGANNKIVADEEFLMNGEKTISPECMKLIDEYFRGQGGGQAFVDKYFATESWGHTPTNASRYSALNIEIEELERRIEQIESRVARPSIMDSIAAKVGRPSLEERLKQLNAQRRLLLQQKEAFDKGARPLDIPFYPSKVYLGHFEDIEEIFPQAPTFDYVQSVMSLNHSEDELYVESMRQLALRLKPGSVHDDTGVRQSYTRFERVDLLVALQEELGPDYKITVCEHQGRTKRVTVERAVMDAYGTRVFYSDEDGAEENLPDHDVYSIREFSKRQPKTIFRNQVIRRLRHLLIPEVDLEQDPATIYESLMKMRMKLRDIFGPNNELYQGLEEEIFSDPEWLAIQHLSPESEEYKRWVDRAMEHIKDTRTEVRNRFIRVSRPPTGRIRTFSQTMPAVVLEDNLARTTAPAPMLPMDPSTAPPPSHSFAEDTTIPPSVRLETPMAIYVPREIPARLLPRGVDYSEELLEEQRMNLVRDLRILQNLLGDHPVNLIEFDTCFTNPLMIFFLCELLGLPEPHTKETLQKSGLVRIENVKMMSGHFPSIRKGLTIEGGSLNDPTDPYGGAFTAQFSLEALKRIDRGELVRIIGICFGSESILEAYGKLKGHNMYTDKGVLQFAPSPQIYNTMGHPSLDYLAGQACAVAITRSGYSIVPQTALNGDLIPLAYEGKLIEGAGIVDMGLHDPYQLVGATLDPVSKTTIWEPDYSLPATAYTMLGGKADTIQAHPEVRLAIERDLEIIKQFTRQTARQTNPGLGIRTAQDVIFRNMDLYKTNALGRQERWIKNDFGMPWMIPTMHHHVKSLIAQYRER